METYVWLALETQRLGTALADEAPTTPGHIALAKRQLSQAAAMARLAAALRISPRSTIDRTAPKLVPSPGPRPWDGADDPPPGAA